MGFDRVRLERRRGRRGEAEGGAQKKSGARRGSAERALFEKGREERSRGAVGVGARKLGGKLLRLIKFRHFEEVHGDDDAPSWSGWHFVIEDAREHDQEVGLGLDLHTVFKHNRGAVRICLQVDGAAHFGREVVVFYGVVRAFVDDAPAIFHKVVEVDGGEVGGEKDLGNVQRDLFDDLAEGIEFRVFVMAIPGACVDRFDVGLERGGVCGPEFINGLSGKLKGHGVTAQIASEDRHVGRVKNLADGEGIGVFGGRRSDDRALHDEDNEKR